MTSVNNKEIDNKEIEFNNKDIDNIEIDSNNIEIGNNNVDEMTDIEISIDNREFINKSKRERIDNKVNMADIEISIRENNYKELIGNKKFVDTINNNMINISSDKILEHIIYSKSGSNNHFSNNNLEERNVNNLSIIIGHKSLLVSNDLLVIIDRNTNICFSSIAGMLKINLKHCTTFIFNKHFAKNICIRIIERRSSTTTTSTTTTSTREERKQQRIASTSCSTSSSERASSSTS